MSQVHDRILEIAVTADESDDTTVATAVTYYRTRADYDAGTGKALTHTAGAAAAAHEITMGEVVPPPTHIIITSTFQA